MEGGRAQAVGGDWDSIFSGPGATHTFRAWMQAWSWPPEAMWLARHPWACEGEQVPQLSCWAWPLLVSWGGSGSFQPPGVPAPATGLDRAERLG